MRMLAGDYDELAGYGEEIVGDDDEADALDAILSGEDDGDFVGAVKRAMRRAGLQPKRGLRRVVNRSDRRLVLGLGLTTLAPGATAIISANPQLPFRVERISTASTGILIENVQVGTVSQFVAAGAVQSEVFAPNAVGIGLKGDTAVPGVTVAITVSNPTLAPLTFGGAIVGSAAQ